jgi:hypothetical protein
MGGANPRFRIGRRWGVTPMAKNPRYVQHGKGTPGNRITQNVSGENGKYGFVSVGFGGIDRGKVMVETTDVKIARIEEKIDRLIEVYHEITELDKRLSDVENRLSKIAGGLAIVAIIYPFVLKYMMGG